MRPSAPARTRPTRDATTVRPSETRSHGQLLSTSSWILVPPREADTLTCAVPLTSTASADGARLPLVPGRLGRLVENPLALAASDACRLHETGILAAGYGPGGEPNAPPFWDEGAATQQIALASRQLERVQPDPAHLFQVVEVVCPAA